MVNRRHDLYHKKSRLIIEKQFRHKTPYDIVSETYDTIDKDGIILSDVLIRPTYRHFGFGTTFVTHLSNLFYQDDIYVDVLDPHLEAFYEPMGFVPSDINEVLVKPASELVF